MPHVKLSPYPNGGTKTEVNGTELLDVVDIQLSFPIDESPRLTVTMLVNTPFPWEGDAELRKISRCVMCGQDIKALR